MRRALLILLVLAFGVADAEARRRHRHYHQRQYIYVVPRQALPVAPEVRPRGVPPPSQEATVAARDPNSGRAYDPAAQLVPPDWQLQPPDPAWKGRRYVSPDGGAWFAVYATPVELQSVAAHMKTVAFADGEEVTYLHGEKDWLAVSGLRAGRIFYRKAVLACGGKRWHHVAFEYPAEARRAMERYVRRAAQAVDQPDPESCASAAATAQ